MIYYPGRNQELQLYHTYYHVHVEMYSRLCVLPHSPRSRTGGLARRTATRPTPVAPLHWQAD